MFYFINLVISLILFITLFVFAVFFYNYRYTSRCVSIYRSVVCVCEVSGPNYMFLLLFNSNHHKRISPRGTRKVSDSSECFSSCWVWRSRLGTRRPAWVCVDSTSTCCPRDSTAAPRQGATSPATSACVTTRPVTTCACCPVSMSSTSPALTRGYRSGSGSYLSGR